MCARMSMPTFAFTQNQDKTFPSKSYFFPCKSAFCLIFCPKPTLFPFQNIFLISLNSLWLCLCRKGALLHDKRRLGHTGKLKEHGGISLTDANQKPPRSRLEQRGAWRQEPHLCMRLLNISCGCTALLDRLVFYWAIVY